METDHLRIRLFIGAILVVLVVLGLRLVQLQLVDHSAYTGESQMNAVRSAPLQPARGLIFDRNGALMVDNAPTYSILLTPRYFNPERAGLLAELLAVPDSVVTARLQDARNWSAFRASRSFRGVSYEQFSRIQENLYRLPGVTYEVEQRRRYHTDARAAHALGYVREITRPELEELRPRGYRPGDLVGKAGVEHQYEDLLRGELGREFTLVNVHGMEVSAYQDGAQDLQPEAGYDLHVSLDAGVQALAESLFVNKRGAAVALDPANGDILALVSMPDYDPAIFSGAVDSETWEALTTGVDRPLFNRATMMRMVPGSTWKPFMALLGLQEGLITPHSTTRCGGGYRLGGRVFRDHNSTAHGRIDVKEAIQESCNTFFYDLMMRTDVNTFASYARSAGFGVRASLDIGQQITGLIPDSSYYNRMYPRGWTRGYSIILGIGQGDMLVTPIELARFTAALANGGTLHEPRLVQRMVNNDTGLERRPDRPRHQQLPFDAEHYEPVRQGMRMAMENGTGRNLQIPDIPSAGKTGTAQNPHGEDHSVFIMFAPYDDPQIAIAVMIENAGYGATVAAPIASMMAEQYLTGEIKDSWIRSFHRDRLVNELESAPVRRASDQAAVDLPQP